MTLPARRAIGAYVQTGIETGVPEADPHKLVLMLFEGALAELADARLKLTGGDIPGRGKAISKAISIIESGLRASLDRAKGGELAERLDSLYEYICGRCLDANIRGQTQPLEEASSLLSELHEAWAGIRGAQPEVAHA